jgi:hypothetical protein
MKKLLALLFALLTTPVAAQTIPSGAWGSMNYWGVGGLSQVLAPGLAGQCLTTQAVGSAPVWVNCQVSSLSLLPPIGANSIMANNTLNFVPPQAIDVNRVLDMVGYDIIRPPLPESIIYKSNVGPNFNWQTLPPGTSGSLLTSGGPTNPPFWAPTATQANLASICQTVGAVLYFDTPSLLWKCLAPGASGQILQTGGAAANPSWLTVTLATLGGVPSTRNINTSAPLGGGGALSADLTLTCPTCATTTNGGALSATAPIVLSAAGAVSMANQGTATTVLHGNAAGNPAFSALTGSDLPIVPLTKGGLGSDQSAATANQIPVYPGSGGSAVPTAPSTWFDNAYCSTIGFLIVRFTSQWNCDSSIPGSVKWWGATGNGSTDDTTAIQNAITAMQAIGGTVYFPQGCYKVTTGLTASGHIKLSGAGSQGDSGGGFAAHGVTTCSTTAGSVITCANNISCFVATTNLSVQIENLQFSYLGTANANTVAITLQAVAGAGNANTQSSIRNVMVTGGDIGVTFTNCLNFNFTDNFVLYQITGAMVVNSPNFPSFQQATIGNNLFWGAATAGYSSHLLVQAGGDLRIVNNKFSTGGVNTNSIALFGASSGSQNMEPMIIAGNSSEGAANCITFSTANASFTVSQILITANQLWCGSKSILIATFGVSQYVIGLTVTGNVLTVNGAASVNPVQVDNVKNATFVGNTLNCSGGCSTSTGFVLGSHSTNVTTQANTYDPGYTTHVSDSGTSNFVWDSPLGMQVTATMGASPTTVTAGSRPETHYVRQNGTQNGNCTIGGQVVGLLINASTYYTFKLNPGESYICTWTTTAPTFARDVQ